MDASRAAALVRVGAVDAGVPVEEISRLVGPSGTTVTELVYRHPLKHVIETGATVMDQSRTASHHPEVGVTIPPVAQESGE